MTSRAARREYLQAVADFELACRNFSISMASILEVPDNDTDGNRTMEHIRSRLGQSKPAKRAPRIRIPANRSQDRG